MRNGSSAIARGRVETLRFVLSEVFALALMTVIAAILTTAMVMQYGYGELPCPLCLLPALCGPRTALALALLPLAACAAGSATLHMLQLPAAWLPLAAGLAGFTLSWRSRR